MSSCCYTPLGHSPPLEATVGKQAEECSTATRKGNKKHVKSISITFLEICTPLSEHWSTRCYSGSSVFCCSVFQQTGSAGGHLVAIYTIIRWQRLCASGPVKGAGQPRSCPGRYDVTGIIGNTVLLNSGFPHAKEFLRKQPPSGNAP